MKLPHLKLDVYDEDSIQKKKTVIIKQALYNTTLKLKPALINVRYKSLLLHVFFILINICILATWAASGICNEVNFICKIRFSSIAYSISWHNKDSYTYSNAYSTMNRLIVYIHRNELVTMVRTITV